MFFPQFFIFLVINDINIVVSTCYPWWLSSETSWPSMGYSSFVWENSPEFHFYAAWQVVVVETELFGVCVGLFWGAGHCS